MDVAPHYQGYANEQSQKTVTAKFRINPRNYNDAFVSDPEGGLDIYIECRQKRGVAMEGDLVEVKLNHCSQWKINYDTIVNRWDDWSNHLLPIIKDLESSKQGINSQKNGMKLNRRKRQSNLDEQTPETQKESDRKRQEEVAKRLPSNLPQGIAKLTIEHIINLPFASRCVQKTGYVTGVVERNHSGLAGGYLKPYNESHAQFSPTDSRVPRMLIDLNECPADFVTQPDRYKTVLFVARMSEWLGNQNFAYGNLVKIMGDSNDVKNRVEALLIEHEIFDEDFPDEALQELDYLKNLPADWVKQSSKGRRDLTDECVFTIDPKTARDLDDALSVKQIAEEIYEVGVHIADVSYFVREMQAVDYCARQRTTSVYLVDRVIPMLPRPLCEHMCSLNPGEPKLTYSVIWKMDKYGHIIDQWFGRTVIKSCVKLAYEQAQDLIDRSGDVSWINEGKDMPDLHAFDWQTISKAVMILNKIARNLRKRRYDKGALRIDQIQLKFVLDQETGKPTGFEMKDRNLANFLIEEFMLLANMCVAKRIYKANPELAFLRRHPPCDAYRLKDVQEFCQAKNFPIDIRTSGSLQKSLNAITDPTVLKVVSQLLLRGMKNAEYVCAGKLTADEDEVEEDLMFKHYALNAPFYTHFTSPIRRYADIIVHRLLSMAIGYDNHTNEDVESLTGMATECNKRKLSSKSISETSQKWYFNLFIMQAGHYETRACVTRIMDRSFEVILVDYDISGRVYIDRLGNAIKEYKMESFCGVKKLVLCWKIRPATGQKKKAKKNRKKALQAGCASADDNQQQQQQEEERTISEQTESHTQVIEVFNVIPVILTVDAKDFTQLKIDLKPPAAVGTSDSSSHQSKPNRVRHSASTSPRLGASGLHQKRNLIRSQDQ